MAAPRLSRRIQAAQRHDAQRPGIDRNWPAPVGGWNARDPLSAMKPNEAFRLENWFPDASGLKARRGYTEFATGIGSGEVETLAEYNAGGARRLLAMGGGGVYDVTAGGAAVLLDTGFASDRWYTANMNGVLGLVGDGNAPQEFDGIALSAMTVSGATALTVTNLIGIYTYKSRSYFWEKNSQDFWYSSLSILGGVLTKFFLSAVASKGGRLVQIISWAHDSGQGPNEYLAFIMNSGEVIVYAGSDPGSNFEIVGRFMIGAPIGERPAVVFGGDVIIITKAGYFPLSKAMDAKAQDDSDAISDRIRDAVKEAADLYATNFGWQPILAPTGNRLIFNVPVAAGAEYQQHVMNTITGRWTKYTGIPARCWGAVNDVLYFGAGDGVVYKFDDGASDAGAAVVCIAWQAWSDYKISGMKHPSAFRPIIECDGALTLTFGFAFDYNTQAQNITVTRGTVGAAWDEEDWDVPAWADAQTVRADWRPAIGEGRVMSQQLTVRNSANTIQWFATDYVFEQAGSF